MSWLTRVWNFARSNELDAELEEELRHHLAMREEERVRSGLHRDDARREARRRLGNQLQMHERAREMDLIGWLDTLSKDVRYACRQIRKSPGFTTVAVLSLALGIGANTGIFTILNAISLRTLPVRNASQLVILSDPDSYGVGMGVSGGERELLTFSEYAQLHTRVDAFDGMFAAESSLPNYDARVNGGDKEEVRAKLVTATYFPVLGIEPAAGRFFAAQEDSRPGNAPFAVLSHDFWQRRFAQSPSAIGSTIRIGAATLTVIGIAGPGFSGETVGQTPDMWVPMSMEPLVKPGTDWLHENLAKDLDKVMWLHVFGRLRPGIAINQAQAQVDVVFKNIIETGYAGVLTAGTQKEFLNQHLKLKPAAKGASAVKQRIRQPLFVLLVLVGLVLLIACANVANLLTAKAAARSREFGVRLALGAGRGRLVRQLLTESLLLAFAGAALGVLVAQGTVQLLLTMFSGDGTPIPLATGLDGPMLAFTAALAVLTVLIFGVVPALRATRVDLHSTLKEGSRAVSVSGRRVTAAKALVAVQVGLSVVLLVGAGLFIRTLRNLQDVKVGYAKDQILQFRLNAEAAGYDEDRRVRLFNDLAEAIRRNPGVHAVSYAENGLFTGTDSSDRIIVEGYTPKGPDDRGSRFDLVGPGYFSGVGIPILLGREIGEADCAGARRVVVINDSFAKKFFAGRNPVGRSITAVFGDKQRAYEVVGVAANARDHKLRGDVPPRYYMPVSSGGYLPGSVRMLIRASGRPETMAAAVYRTIQSIDDNLPVDKPESVGAAIDAGVSRERTVARLSAILGGIALALACIGLYGVLSYGVSRRTGEIGIRMALGARRSEVIALVLREATAMIGAGIVAGLLAALACSRLVAAQLFGVAPQDPLTVAASVGVLTAVGILAGFLPARRASRVNPVIALRTE